MLILFTICSCYETKNQYDCIWLKIFYHNSVGGVFFSNFSHGMFSLEPNLYSIFSLITDDFRIDGKFEFLLEYPGSSGYNRWRQSFLPWNNNEVSGKKAEGYENIYITWSGSDWGGLVKSNNGYGLYTLIDGSAGKNLWHYAIGCISTRYSPRFPGPNGGTVLECRLWIRMSDLSLIKKETLLYPPKQSTLVHILFFLIVQ